MITQHPHQESTLLQDLQTGLDEFQSRDTPKADLLLDGTRLFRGDALTEPFSLPAQIGTHLTILG